jgi:hypothetical protein
MVKKFISITISIIIIFLIAVVIYESNASDKKKQTDADTETGTSAEEMLLPETTPDAASETSLETSPDTAAETSRETATTEISSTPVTTTAIETIETDTEEINKNLLTLRLVVYEGPVIVQDGDMCYYRVEAIAAGDPYPVIKFSKDDSNGAWGRNKAQVNLRYGESYNLIVTAVNTSGEVTRRIELTWNQ